MGLGGVLFAGTSVVAIYVVLPTMTKAPVLYEELDSQVVGCAKSENAMRGNRKRDNFIYIKHLTILLLV
jgi:hypothetical protein